MAKQKKDKTEEDLRKLKTADELLEHKRLVEDELLQEVLGTFAGRRIIFKIIAEGDIYFDVNGPLPFDVGPANRNQGRREIAIELLKECLRVEPNSYITMQQEAGNFEAMFIPIEDDSDDDESNEDDYDE